MPYKYEPDGGVDDDGNNTYSMVWYPDVVDQSASETDVVDQSASETFDALTRDQKPGEVVNSSGIPLGTTQEQMDKYFSSLKPGETAIGGYDAAQYNEIKKIAADQGFGKNWLDSALAAGKGYVDKAIAKYTTKNGDIDWGSLGKDVLSFGAAVSAYNSASQPIPKTGYKGGIPDYTALSERTADPGADYRPGQGGHQYFTGNFFADPKADQSGDQGLAALQKLVAQQKADIEAANAKRSAAYNAANPAFKSTDVNSNKFFGRATKDNLATSTIGNRTENGTLVSNLNTNKTDTTVGSTGADTIKTHAKFDPTKNLDALNLFVKNLQDLISGGNEAAAKKIYAAKQAQYGFTDAEVAPYILGGKFSANQIGEWKSNPVSPNDPDQKAALAQFGQGLQSLVSGGDEAGAKALYNQKQKDLGFTDAQIAPYLLGGKFDATQIGQWKSNTATTGANTGINGLTGGVTGQDTANTGITGLTEATPTSQNNTLAESNITTPVTTGVASNQSAPKYTDKQIQDAIAASRAQGYSDEDILKGAKNNFGGLDVSQYLTPTPFAAGGSLNYHGTYLQGDTDGMADKIPGTIDGIQPARLAHGEFVIPADVVSHLGNGNSDAGAKQLYKMMDKIRMARTGTKNQGKKIDPNKFMPGGLAQIAQYAKGGILRFAGTDSSLVPTGTIGTEQGLSEWAGPYVTQMLGKGQALVNKELTNPQFYQGPLTAGDSALQQKAYYNAGNLSVPESIGTAANTAGTAATKMGNLSYRPGDIASFMSPYTQNVTDVVNQEAKRNADIAANQRHANAVSAGAFGGSRQAIADAEADRNLAMLQSANTARGLQDAYTAATNASQFGANYGLNALQGATAAASTQGSLGAAQNAAGLANLNAQLTAGNQQQATTQAGLTADKAMFAEQKADPFNMLKYQQELISGLPIQSSSYNMLNNPWTAAAGAASTVNTALTQK